jgi:uncharacterized membrane protein
MTIWDRYAWPAIGLTLMIVAVVGSAGIFTSPKLSTMSRLGLGAFVLAVGTVTGAYVAWIRWDSPGRSVVGITVSEGGLSWVRANGTSSGISWSANGLNLILWDRTKLHQALGDRDKMASQVIVLPGSTRAALTLEAYTSILATAKQCALHLRHGSFPSFSRAPPIDYTVITRR